MAKKDLGKKRTCQSCYALYYDLNRVPSACPKCGAEFETPKSANPRRGRGSARAVPLSEAMAAAKAAETKPSAAPDAELSEAAEGE